MFRDRVIPLIRRRPRTKGIITTTHPPDPRESIPRHVNLQPSHLALINILASDSQKFGYGV